MAAAAIQTFVYPNAAPRRLPSWTGTPEIYFTKSIDNSRLVKIEDPRRAREMRQFGIALACLFLFVMAYAFQHFRAIEYGYKIEALKSKRDSVVEMNRALRLEEASLRDPERIDRMARALGLQSPEAGQVVEMNTALPEGSGAEVASLTPVAVVSNR
jgi:cell division protein FtsL